MAKSVTLSVVVVNFNTPELTRECLDSVVKNTKGVDYEIIVVDNGSEKKFKGGGVKVKLITEKKNLGFAGANNVGWRAARGEYILFLNSDTLVGGNVLGEMVEWLAKSPKIGAASCALKNEDGTPQTSGGYFPTLARVFSWMIIQDFPLMDALFTQFHPKRNKPVAGEQDWVMGAFVLTRRDILEKVGGWSEDYFMYAEEVDLQYKIKELGYQIWYNPKWSIIHLGGRSSQTREFPLLSEYEGVKLFYRKHYPAWQYPILRLLLKIGALGRVVLFGILRGKEAGGIYAKAFSQV